MIDQNAKLSVFCTRPAIYAPIFNFLVEFLGTTVLIGGAELISYQRHFLPVPLNQLWPSFYAFYVGWFIFLIILGLGGPTGVLHFGFFLQRPASVKLPHCWLDLDKSCPSQVWPSTLHAILDHVWPIFCCRSPGKAPQNGIMAGYLLLPPCWAG